MNKNSIYSALLLVISLLIGFSLAEITYRVYLYKTEPYYFQDESGLWYFQSSPVQFDEQFGFSYVPGGHAGGALYDGQVTNCWSSIQDYVFNERGNSGRIKGEYSDADLKVLVFGDSVSQRPRKYEQGIDLTWSDFLQDAIAEKISGDAHVVNFSRDGYGVLQMFDLAVAKVEEWKPDLVVIAFISDDLTRDRLWRSVAELDGRQRILVSRQPDPAPDWSNAAEAFMLEPRATHEWCEQLRESGVKGDPLAAELMEAAAKSRRRNGLLADPYSLSKSYIYEKLVYDSPYYSSFNREGPTQMPRYDGSVYEADDLFVRQVERLEQTGVPYVLVHLALYSQMVEGTEYYDDPRDAGLLKSLEMLTGREVHGTLESIDISNFDLEQIPTDPESDRHPSIYGHAFYAEAVFNVLLEEFDELRQFDTAESPLPDSK